MTTKVLEFVFAIFYATLFLADIVVGGTVQNVRLLDGSSPNEGRIEVKVYPESSEEVDGWGTVCAEDWDKESAHWVCNTLGYREAAVFKDTSSFGDGDRNSPVFACELSDSSSERQLECEVTEDCGNYGITGVICQKPGYLGCARLMGPRERPSGSDLLETNRNSQTNDACINFCRGISPDARYAIQRNDECQCARDSWDLPENQLMGDCDVTCSLNFNQTCGGGMDRYSVFNIREGFCTPFDNTPNLIIISGGFRFGDVVRAECNDGFTLQGDGVLQCTGDPASYDWNGTIPTCDEDNLLPRTPSPSPVTNKEKTPLWTSTLFPFTDNGFMSRPGVTVVSGPGNGDTTVYSSTSVNTPMGNGNGPDSGSLGAVKQTIIAVIVVAAMLMMSGLLLCLFMKRRMNGKEKQGTRMKGTINNANYGMPNAAANEVPNYYEVEPATIPDEANALRNTDSVEGLIDNVLYRPSDNLPANPKYYEIEGSVLSSDTRNGDENVEGLIDNVLYRPSGNDPAHPNYYEIEPNGRSEDPIDARSKDDNDGGLIDNVLYRPSENVPNNVVKYYEVGPTEVFGTPNDLQHSDEDVEVFEDNVLYKPCDVETNIPVSRPGGKNQKGEIPEGVLIDNILYHPSDTRPVERENERGTLDSGVYDTGECNYTDVSFGVSESSPNANPAYAEVDSI